MRSDEMSKYAIEFNNINKTFKDFSIDDLNLKVNKGYITGFIGPNGAGKSTCINLIMDLIKPDNGSINILGYDHIQEGQMARENIGFVYAENVFYDHLSVETTGKTIGKFYKNWNQHAYNHFIEQFKLPANKKVKNLSTGMKVKLFLSVALSHGAELIILDEPTSGLDPIVRSEILDILYDIIQDEAKTILFSSHITNDLEKIADYIVLINDGQIIIDYNKNDILNTYRLVKGSIELLDNDLRPLLIGLEEKNTGFTGLTKEGQTFEEIFGDNIIIEPASLEDIMVRTIKNGGL